MTAWLLQYLHVWEFSWKHKGIPVTVYLVLRPMSRSVPAYTSAMGWCTNTSLFGKVKARGQEADYWLQVAGIVLYRAHTQAAFSLRWLETWAQFRVRRHLLHCACAGGHLFSQFGCTVNNYLLLAGGRRISFLNRNVTFFGHTVSPLHNKYIEFHP